MDYRYLKTFIVVSKHLSFSKAAEELLIAQSAVSRQIKLLEESINHQLFIRSSAKVLHTQIGAQLYQECLRFDNLMNSNTELEEQKELRIGLFHGLLEGWFSDFIIKNQKKIQNKITIHIYDIAPLHQKLLANELDIIFTSEYVQNDLITSLKLFDEALLIASKDKLSIKDITKLDWIVYGSEDPLLRKFKNTSGRIIAIDSITAMKKLIQAGVGIGILPDHILGSDKNKFCVLPLGGQNRSQSPIYMQTLSYRVLPNSLDNFSKLIKSELK